MKDASFFSAAAGAGGGGDGSVHLSHFSDFFFLKYKNIDDAKCVHLRSKNWRKRPTINQDIQIYKLYACSMNVQ